MAIRAGAFIALLVAAFPCTGADQHWPPDGGVPVTAWGKDVSADGPVLPEYPRPQLVRADWLNLNGRWDYATAPLDAPQPSTYEGTILVPFPPQAVLSGIGHAIDPQHRVWYRRRVEIPATWAGQRILLHFGAVDWEAHVAVNGIDVGTHRGGYDGFTCDITDAVRPGGTQELVVSAWNPVEGGQPRGKQALKPSGIFYTPTTGIWQTVWLEPVPTAHIAGLRIVTDIDAGTVELLIDAPGADGMTCEAIVSADGKEVARGTRVSAGALRIAIPRPRLWWPASPFLYDARVTLSDCNRQLDAVDSYFGMRAISLGPNARGQTSLLLNHRPILQLGLLDQGFWPDGIYTAPSDAALRSDIEAARQLGFNMLRKHVKVEPERWYYWADKLGMLVWQDMPSATEMGFTPRKTRLDDLEGIFESELRRMVQGRFNHPAIVVWVPFNEGWGLTEAPKQAKGDKDRMAEVSRRRQERMVSAIRAEDPTRLIDAESGAGGGANQGANFWDAGLGDILDFHCYGGDAPMAEARRASAIGETGWGVSVGGSLPRFLKTIAALGESAIVITQLTDVENETNGALRYDRSAKTPLEPVGRKVIELLREAGYQDYPGGARPQDERP